MTNITFGDYAGLDGLAIAAGIRSRQFSAVDIVDAALAGAEALNPALNAITCQTFEQASEQAARIDGDASLRGAPFAGVPFLIKDISPVTGLPQTAQSRLFEGVVADHDANIVTAFRQAGLVSLGKSNTPELCLTITTESVLGGPCHNPWNLRHSTGGSSGGSAAAVAAGIVPIAHATDGGGSIRVPASCCGLVGLKPSRGLTPVEFDLASNWYGMSVGHVVTRTVRDSAAMLDTLRLRRPVLYALPPGPKSYLADLTRKRRIRVALQTSHPSGAEIHPEVGAALTRTALLLEALGHRVEECSPPVDYKALSELTGTIIFVAVAQSILPRLEELKADLETPLLEEVTKRMARRGASIGAIDLARALDGLNALARKMESFHKDYEVVLSPVLSQPPAPLGWLNMNDEDIRTYAERFSRYSGFCALYNATGQPSLSAPVHSTSDGLPIGVLLSARWGGDGLLLHLAQQLEQQVGWADRRPPLSSPDAISEP